MEIPGTENTPELTPDSRHHGQGGEEKIWLIMKGPHSDCDIEFFSKSKEIP